MTVLAFILGSIVGYVIARTEGFFHRRRHDKIVKDLLNRVQAQDPWTYQVMTETSADASEKTADSAGVEVDLQPWLTDPEYEGVDVFLDHRTGLVHVTTDEDTYEEDMRLFLAKYGLTQDDLHVS